MNRLCYSASIMCLQLLVCVTCFADKPVFGYVERVTLVANHLTLPAKVDTGAKSASLNATQIKKIKKEGKTYLQFVVPNGQQTTQFVCEYLGKVSIKLRKDEMEDDSDYQTLRPMVLMRVQLGNQEAMLRVNLANRSHFVYPMLLGRESIKAFNATVDPSRKFKMGQ